LTTRRAQSVGVSQYNATGMKSTVHQSRCCNASRNLWSLQH